MWMRGKTTIKVINNTYITSSSSKTLLQRKDIVTPEMREPTTEMGKRGTRAIAPSAL